jgi:hypothetical protein
MHSNYLIMTITDFRIYRILHRHYEAVLLATIPKKIKTILIT